jgi:hypothetical protein
MLLFIPYKVPSSKNSRMMTSGGKFIASKATQDWKKRTRQYWSILRKDFVQQCIGKEGILIVGFHFVRGTKHRWDFINPLQTVQDEMTAHQWISDDNADIMLPVPLKVNGEYWSYDKDKPGVYIKVLSSIEEATFNFTTENHAKYV